MLDEESEDDSGDADEESEPSTPKGRPSPRRRKSRAHRPGPAVAPAEHAVAPPLPVSSEPAPRTEPDEPTPPAEPVVFWGSEELDPAQRAPVRLSVAVYSKRGEHKSHPCEDRYTIKEDLNEELLRKLGEDASTPAGSVSPSNAFFAVYDGHGGSDSASYAASRLHLHLGEDWRMWRDEPRKAIQQAFARTEADLVRMHEHSGDKSGSCALSALVRGHRLFIAGLGDSRALLLRGDRHPRPIEQLTVDQRATEPSEARRISKEGGKVEGGRVWGALMPSRTLGDVPWKRRPGLSAEPVISEFEVTADDKYLVLGSDGLFDVLSNKTIGRLLCKLGSSAQRACADLVREMKKRPGLDDVTILVVHFEHGVKVA